MSRIAGKATVKYVNEAGKQKPQLSDAEIDDLRTAVGSVKDFSFFWDGGRSGQAIISFCLSSCMFM